MTKNQWLTILILALLLVGAGVVTAQTPYPSPVPPTPLPVGTPVIHFPFADNELQWRIIRDTYSGYLILNHSGAINELSQWIMSTAILMSLVIVYRKLKRGLKAKKAASD